MTIAAFILSLFAILIAGLSARYAQQQAEYTRQQAEYSRRQAEEAERTRAIEHARRHDEREPKITGEIETIGSQDAYWCQLRLTLESGDPLERLEVTILDHENATFFTNQDGVAPMNAMPKGAFHEPAGGLRQGQRACWRIELGSDVSKTVRLRVLCQGRDTEGEPVTWSSLINAEVLPGPPMVYVV